MSNADYRLATNEPHSVTCIMPTYNRLKSRKDGTVDAVLVEEAIESYVRQTLPNKQLIILNDTPGQTLHLPRDYREEHNIRLLNWNSRQKTLGDKCNYGIGLATGDYVTRWDDDDISLPHRLSACVDQLQDLGDPKLLIVEGYWMTWQNGWDAKQGRYGFQQDLTLRTLADKVRYRSISSYEDQRFRQDCQEASEGSFAYYAPQIPDFHYVYRWSGTGSYHASNGGSDTESKYREIGAMPILQVDYELQPHWAQDYVQIAREKLHALNSDNDHGLKR